MLELVLYVAAADAHDFKLECAAFANGLPAYDGKLFERAPFSQIAELAPLTPFRGTTTRKRAMALPSVLFWKPHLKCAGDVAF
jgi:hypothetical protein